MSSLDALKIALRGLGSAQKARVSASFFKTGEGHYGAGDVFLGVTVPEQRAVAKRFRDLPLADVLRLLRSKEHEFRLTALLLLVAQFDKGSPARKESIFKAYLSHTKWINNWDLVDSSAPSIVGVFLLERDASLLLQLARSSSLWERRIAMVSSLAFIRQGKPEMPLKVAALLLSDKHDLIHKAVGWMLREVGKRCSLEAETAFLDKHHRRLSRTTLRYAIERFPAGLRAHYMSLKLP
jgi:3-methyladenine DNA glycosylase AlkD